MIWQQRLDSAWGGADEADSFPFKSRVAGDEVGSILSRITTEFTQWISRGGFIASTPESRCVLF